MTQRFNWPPVYTPPPSLLHFGTHFAWSAVGHCKYSLRGSEALAPAVCSLRSVFFVRLLRDVWCDIRRQLLIPCVFCVSLYLCQSDDIIPIDIYCFQETHTQNLNYVIRLKFYLIFLWSFILVFLWSMKSQNLVLLALMWLSVQGLRLHCLTGSQRIAGYAQFV